MTRLCKLYIGLEKNPDAASMIQEIRSEIEILYAEIMNITKEVSLGSEQPPFSPASFSVSKPCKENP